ncbi:hypothetical protein [Alicyclobacillus acidiphilus]|uniref:hypothetical protein n=1 Tax=Alicyclobacillus acidiphilus TaxID=182455 RepID=UPI0008323DC9|nr:hypothetical protein [Alicyclobacillus acidiphilus]
MISAAHRHLLTFYELLLTTYGAIPGNHAPSVSFNLDLWWGLLVLVAGILFILGSLRRPREPEDDED